MKNKSPDSREKATDWCEIKKLYDQVLKLFYEQRARSKALTIAPKLRLLVSLLDPGCNAVLGAAARGLLCELEGDYWGAIQSRQRELHLLNELQDAQLPAHVRATPNDISDRLDLLASLYWESGDLEKAEQTLLESQRLCAKHKIKFDGESMLRELRREKRLLAHPKTVTRKRAS